MNHSHPPQSDTLSWQAARWLLGELSAAQQQEFEQLLEASQAAREALAREVELLQAVAQIGGHTGANAQPVTLARRPTAAECPATATAWFTWLISGAMAASLLLAATLGMKYQSMFGPRDFDHVARDNRQVEQLVALWSADLAAEHSSVELFDELEVDPREVTSEEAALLAPSWMYAAVAAESDSTATPGEDGEQWQ